MRKKVMAVVFAILAFSLIAASAATLGGITASDVGADTEIVAACNGGVGGITVDWTTSYDATDARYEVTGVTVDGLTAGCDSEPISVTLAGTGGTPVLVELTGFVSATGSASWASGVDVDVEALEYVAIVVG